MHARRALERQCFKYCIARNGGARAGPPTPPPPPSSDRAEGRGRRGEAGEGMRKVCAHVSTLIIYALFVCARRAFTTRSVFSRAFARPARHSRIPAFASLTHEGPLFSPLFVPLPPSPPPRHKARRSAVRPRESDRAFFPPSSKRTRPVFYFSPPFRPPIRSTYQIFFFFIQRVQLHVKYIDRKVELYKKSESACSAGRAARMNGRKF